MFSLLLTIAMYVSFQNNRLDRLEHAVIIEEEFEAIDIIYMEDRWELLAWRRDSFGELQCFAVHSSGYPLPPTETDDTLLDISEVRLVQYTIDNAVFPRASNGAIYFYDEYVWLHDESKNITISVIRKLKAGDIEYHNWLAKNYQTPDQPKHIERGFKYPFNLELTPEQIKAFTITDIGFFE